jgi:GGDEF domain-containing protein
MEEVFSAMRRPFTHNEIELAITCSAGCALADGTQHPDEIVRVADRTMYQAKNEGRNRYLVSTLPRAI